MAEVIKHDAGDNNFARVIIHFTKKSLNILYFSNHRVYFKGTVKRFSFLEIRQESIYEHWFRRKKPRSNCSLRPFMAIKHQISQFSHTQKTGHSLQCGHLLGAFCNLILSRRFCTASLTRRRSYFGPDIPATSHKRSLEMRLACKECL